MDLIGILDYVGVAAFAVTGVLKGIKHRLDIFGVFVLAIFTALGGGIARDLLLGIAPPKALSNPCYWWVIAAAVILTLALKRRAFLKTDSMVLNIADAVGLAAFTVMGCEIAAASNAPGAAVIFCGIVTAAGGGVIRDLLVLEIPLILRVSVYATAALLGAVCFYALYSFVPEMPDFLSAAITFSIVFATRVIAILKRWNLPRAA